MSACVSLQCAQLAYVRVLGRPKMAASIKNLLQLTTDPKLICRHGMFLCKKPYSLVPGAWPWKHKVVEVHAVILKTFSSVVLCKKYPREENIRARNAKRNTSKNLTDNPHQLNIDITSDENSCQTELRTSKNTPNTEPVHRATKTDKCDFFYKRKPFYLDLDKEQDNERDDETNLVSSLPNTAQHSDEEKSIHDKYFWRSEPLVKKVAVGIPLEKFGNFDVESWLKKSRELKQIREQGKEMRVTVVMKIQHKVPHFQVKGGIRMEVERVAESLKEVIRKAVKEAEK